MSRHAIVSSWFALPLCAHVCCAILVEKLIPVLVLYFDLCRFGEQAKQRYFHCSEVS